MALVSAENMTMQASGFGNLPALRQLGLLVGLALTIALGVTIAMWSQTPNYSVLQGNLNAKNLAQITQSLDGAGIEYKLTNDGHTLMVPLEKLQQAKMKIASQGIVIGDTAGYALLDQSQGLGSSSFMQKVRYKQAMEGELAKSISKLDMIASARVHLAIPKQSAFIRKNSKPTASVILDVQPGRVLDDSQIAGIVNMVASSVAGMEARDVTIIDQKGRLLSQRGSDSMIMTSNEFNYTHHFEEEYAKRIVNIISPIVGIGGVRAQVVADIDFTAQEQTRESYRPDQKALRSEQVYKETNTEPQRVGGIPGALSNQPPATGTTIKPVANIPGENGKKTKEIVNTGQSTSRAIRNYELDRTISHTRTQPVSLKRLSVAVLVNYIDSVDKRGRHKQVPLDKATMARITSLVKETVGLNKSRGDTINVVNTPFQEPEQVAPMPAPSMWKQPWVLRLAKQLLGGLGVLFVVLGVLRPMLKNLSTNSTKETNSLRGEIMPQGQLAAPGGGGQQAALADGDGLSGNAQSAMQQTTKIKNEQQLVELASNIAKDDPRRVAQVMTTWVEEDE